MSQAHLRDPQSSISVTFERTADAISSQTVTVRELLALIGEQALLLFVTFMAIPFLLPVAIPGTSTVFGALILLVGFGVLLNRIPWLPDRLLDHALGTRYVVPALRAGANLARRFEKLIRPRWLGLTEGATGNRVNGLVLIWAALLLMVPLPLVPFTNTLPAIGIVLLAVGMAERDGLLIVLGYLATAIATVYIGGLLFAIYYLGLNAAELLQRWF